MPALTRTTRALAGLALSASIALGTAGVAAAAPSVEPDTTALWAAIALGPNSGHTAYAGNYRGRSAADKAALSRCNARDCQIVVEVSNGCGALAQAPNGRYGWAYARGRGTAERSAENAAGRGARLLGYACAGQYTA